MDGLFLVVQLLALFFGGIAMEGTRQPRRLDDDRRGQAEQLHSRIGQSLLDPAVDGTRRGQP
jgi:hypothetical protein